MKAILLFFLSISFISSNAQENNTLFSRLQGMYIDGVQFFNIDGVEIVVQPISGDFSKKNITKKFRKYSIRETDLLQADTSIIYNNYMVAKAEEIAPSLIQNSTWYFIDISGIGIKAITFTSINKTEKALEKEFLQIYFSNSIPYYIYEKLNIDSINFAGRKIALGSSCRWMSINNVQCPFYGQMNWSIHKTMDDALNTVTNQFKVTQSKKQGKVISEEQVDIVFEGNEVKAKRVIYDLKGIPSLLVGVTGNKTLTIYYVAASVRQNFVSCVMSFWNNDAINPSGLPPLLEQVMKLKN